jgi:hypothetical protein
LVYAFSLGAKRAKRNEAPDKNIAIKQEARLNRPGFLLFACSFIAFRKAGIVYSQIIGFLGSFKMFIKKND